MPAKPSFSVAYSTLWIEANCSKCAQVGQAVIIGIFAAFFSLIAARRGDHFRPGRQAAGGIEPGLLEGIRLIHITIVEELKGSAPIEPSFSA